MNTTHDPVWELFSNAINAAGGMEAMVRDRRLRWLPDLMESAYTLLLQEEEHRGFDEIADVLGITRDSVESILTGPPDTAIERIGAAPPSDPLEREHIAGGLIRHAYIQPGSR